MIRIITALLLMLGATNAAPTAAEQSYLDLSDAELFQYQGGKRIGEYCYVGLGGPNTACKFYVKAEPSSTTSYNGWPRTTSDRGTGCVKDSGGSFCFFQSSSYMLTNDERQSMCQANAVESNAAAQLRHAIRNGACGKIPYDVATQNALDMSDDELFSYQGGKKLGEHCYISKGGPSTACGYYVKAKPSLTTSYNGWPRTVDDKGTGCVKQSSGSFCYFNSMSYDLTQEERDSMCKPNAVVSNAAAQLRHALRNGACGSLLPSCKEESVFFHDCHDDVSFLSGKTWGFWQASSIGGDLQGFLEEDFQSHRSGQSGFIYAVGGLVEGTTYSIRLGFAEVYKPNCMKGKRVMEVKVNGETFEAGIDVYKQSGGCATALVLTKDFTLSGKDSFDIEFTSTVENPMVSIIEVRKTCASATSSPTLAPIASPTNSPIAPSSPSPTAAPCQATSGVCASASAELQNFLDTASHGDVVSICSGASLATSSSVTVTTNSLTLCCEGSGCVMNSDGSDRVLSVSGEDVTLEGIEFVGGRSNRGGNVLIDAPGDHHINNCVFRDGNGGFYGGNLIVDPSNFVTMEEGSISIKNSDFYGGVASGAGANAFITSAGTISISDCSFVDGVSSGWGAGGIMIASSFGTMPSLEILNTTFENNVGGDKGAAATVHLGSNLADVTLSGNSGSGNVGSPCSGILLGLYSGECIAVDEAYP